MGGLHNCHVQLGKVNGCKWYGRPQTESVATQWLQGSSASTPDTCWGIHTSFHDRAPQSSRLASPTSFTSLHSKTRSLSLRFFTASMNGVVFYQLHNNTIISISLLFKSTITSVVDQGHHKRVACRLGYREDCSYIVRLSILWCRLNRLRWDSYVFRA